jgi:hypothetical protein
MKTKAKAPYSSTKITGLFAGRGPEIGIPMEKLYTTAKPKFPAKK